jgi:hypothetical protein
MRKTAVQWILAVLVTLLSARWQTVTGPTYPVRDQVSLGGQQIEYRLERSHSTSGDQAVQIRVPDSQVAGEVAWRRYPTTHDWQFLAMRRDGELLEAALPHQPPAGKLEYQVRLRRGIEQVALPPRPAVTRFKGDVSALILVPHILAMFLAMLMSTRAGLAALFGGNFRRAGLITLGLLIVGGFVLGPAVQKQAFGAWWTGVPYGYDLTDNKTLIAAAAWVWAAWRLRGNRPARYAVLAAALVVLVVFAIPHSTWGSEIQWDQPRV